MISFELMSIFMLLALLSYLTPGPDWAVISKGVFRSKKEGMLTAFGVQSGLFFHLVLGSLGATVILTTSKTAFSILQIIGAFYLVYLGGSGLREIYLNRNQQQLIVAPQNVIKQSKQKRNPFLIGLLANIFNPKVAIFFISILPQFINPSLPPLRQVIILGMIDIIIGVFWWILFVYALYYIQNVFLKGNAQVIIESITNVFLLLFGIVMLVSAFFI
ncbi:putative transporter protein [Xenorhabdus poinarii G6]|uniref:Putative transporter protein n=1 Tax=Xenorhabdus poinarii G6 TaxID=1354304 RepID=A0A068R6I3_9GAMM|nr:LysE family translocator [Xenorhabdus poinarii]CDG22877.1 putative transporter protein [Xenorhabdus poinarii G6]